MSFVIVFLAILCLIQLKTGIKEPLDDYITPKGTLAVKGLFVAIVFLSHSTGYVTYGDSLLHLFMLKTCSALNQLMVVPFFFYSGYGVAVSAASKKDYGKNLPKKRLLPLFLKFAFAILLFLGAAGVVEAKYTPWQIASAFIGWESVGNSNWFIFATFALYAASWIGLTFFKNQKTSTFVITVLTFGYIGAVVAAGRSTVWYDTVLAFPLGMWFALYKDKFDEFTKKLSRWIVGTILCGAGFMVFWYLFKVTEGQNISAVALIFKSLFFALGLVFVTRRFSPRNKVLEFFGNHVFSIYILQRLPMLMLERFAPSLHPVVFAAISFSATIILAILFDKFVLPEKLLSKLEKTNK